MTESPYPNARLCRGCQQWFNERNFTGNRCEDCYYVETYGWPRGFRKCFHCRQLFHKSAFGIPPDDSSWCQLCREEEAWRAVVGPRERKVETLTHSANATAARHNVPGRLEKYEVWRLLEHTNWHCLYCGLTCADEHQHRMTLDHVRSTIQGGVNYLYNIVPACRSCNAAKHDYELKFFLARRNIDYADFAIRWMEMLQALAVWKPFADR